MQNERVPVGERPHHTTRDRALQVGGGILLAAALSYAARGWRVFPVHTPCMADGASVCSCGRPNCTDTGKHPRIRAWQKTATLDRGQVEAWWEKWPDANIGIACGSGLIVLDLDGPDEIKKFAGIAAPYRGLPETLTCLTGRGVHLYLTGHLPNSRKVDGLLVRGDGGYVIAPPSLHASGRRYQWANQHVTQVMAPDWFINWAQATDKPHTNISAKATMLVSPTAGLPAYIINKNNNLSGKTSSKTEKAAKALGEAWSPYIEARVRSALAAIDADCERDQWLHIGMALHACDWRRPDGSDASWELWLEWSRRGRTKFQGEADLATRWRSFGRHGVTLGTLFHLAEQAGWLGYYGPTTVKTALPHSPVSGLHNATPHPFFTAGETMPLSAESVNPEGKAASGQTLELSDEVSSRDTVAQFLELNSKYSVIGDIGGKCLVLGWVPSKTDEAIQVPSFQSFKSFSERYANRKVNLPKENKKGEIVDEWKALGATWLTWKHRRSFDGIDMIPNAPGVVNNILNLWQGFAVTPTPGRWDLLQRHIVEVLAAGNIEAAEYIFRWAAWSVQHPGERAEVALVFRGEKGTGKGTFAHAMRRLFGQHGLHVSNSKHMTGAFNAHLRSCLLLYADEAFWAGDKQGESTLKALITEPVMMIEQKGVDAMQWRNRLHVIMTANAEWVVPASHDERRYVVFDVNGSQKQNESYFDPLHHQLRDGGLAAMLHDLLAVDLKGWHPRKIVNTEALRRQKERSMPPLYEWFEAVLQDGILPYASKETPDICAASVLLENVRQTTPRIRELTPTGLGRFLSQMGATKIHRAGGNVWRFAPVPAMRKNWEQRFNGWRWDFEIDAWQVRH